MSHAKMHNWDDFRYFWAVANSGSYSQAAKQLKVNHSTVSRRIQTLEQSHGVKLFERTQQGYQLTQAGASIYEIVEKLHNDSLKASRVLQGQDARLEGNINITMPHDVFEFLLAKPLKEFSQQHPAISLNLMVSNGLRNMANREADIAVRITPSPPDYLIGTQVTQLQHGLYQCKNLPVTEHTPIVVWSGINEMPTWATEHFENPKLVLKIDDLFSMYQAVKAGFGIARMPCFLPDIIGDIAVQRLPILLPRSDWGVWILHHEDLRQSAKINHCKNFLKDSIIQNISYFSGENSAEVFTSGD
ncbi:LysR family transcriptional regulator [Colwelliaceae bacterium 6441]